MDKNYAETYSITFMCSNCKATFVRNFPKGTPAGNAGICPKCGCASGSGMKEHTPTYPKPFGNKEILLEQLK